MTRIIHYNILKKFMMILFVILYISILFTPSYFLKLASADNAVPRYEGEIIFPTINNTLTNTNHTNSIILTQNTTLTNTNHTNSIILPKNTTVLGKTNPGEGFSNIVCKSGYQYVQMMGQYTAGNISYKVIFLQMALLDSDGSIIAKGHGLVDEIDAHKTKTFTAITRYPSTFSSCTIQIDNVIPK